MKILRVEIQTNNLEGTVFFLRSILGLESLTENSEQLRFKLGSSELVFTEGEAERPVYHFAFEVPMNRLDELAVLLDNRVHWIKQPDGGLFADFKAWNARSIY